MTPPLTANDLTARLLIEIPKRFSGARVWRRNVGKAIGMHDVHGAVKLLGAGQIKAAIQLLQRRPIAFGVPGEPDLDGILPPSGTRLGIEVKVGKDRLSDEQTAFGVMLRNAGGIWIVARSVEQALAELAAAQGRAA